MLRLKLSVSRKDKELYISKLLRNEAIAIVSKQQEGLSGKAAPLVLLPYIHLGKNVPRYFCRVAAGGTIVRGDICRKEPRVVRGFHISYKPSVDIFAVDASGAGFSIEVSGFGRGQKDRVLYCIDILDTKAKAVFIKLSQMFHLFDGGNL